MYRRLPTLVFTILIVMVLFGMTIAHASPGHQGPPAAIRLEAATFLPGQGEAPRLPAALTIGGYLPGQRGYYIVQFRGPVQQVWKDQVTALGAEMLDYIPDFAFKVRMTPAVAAQVQKLGAVAWVGLFHPGYKLSPELTRDGVHLYRVRLERGVQGGAVAAAIAAVGAEIIRDESGILLVAADSRLLEAIAQVLDVAWVEDFLPYEKYNEYAAGDLLRAGVANANGYDGSTQIVAVADTGLGGGAAATAHRDIAPDRIAAIYNWTASNTTCYRVTTDGPADVDSGHGTHVAGSVLGSGGPQGAPGLPGGGGLCRLCELVLALLHGRVCFDRAALRQPAALPAGLRRRSAHPFRLLGKRRPGLLHDG